MEKMKFLSESIPASSAFFWNRFQIVRPESVFGIGIDSGIGCGIRSRIGIGSGIGIGIGSGSGFGSGIGIGSGIDSEIGIGSGVYSLFPIFILH